MIINGTQLATKHVMTRILGCRLAKKHLLSIRPVRAPAFVGALRRHCCWRQRGSYSPNAVRMRRPPNRSPSVPRCRRT